MVKLLLTSTGLANLKITTQFLNLINKPLTKIKIIFVPTASRTKEELHYVSISKKQLVDLGIPEKSIKTVKLNKPVSFEEVKDFDVMYVCGGNTFYLLKAVRETGFDKVIARFVKENKLYFGVSAGSILAGPNIDIAGSGDENDVKLKDLTALSLTDIIVSPHYTEAEKSIIDKFKKKSKYKIVTLTDEQAFVVIDGKEKII